MNQPSLFYTLDPATRLAPIVKWPGGKTWAIDYLRPLIREADRQGRRFVELFTGGAAVTLGLAPQRAAINDANRTLIALYRHIRDGSLDTAETRAIPTAGDRETYYANRARFNDLLLSGDEASASAAYLFYYLNRTGYNGLVRYSLAGRYNVPHGQMSSRTLHTAQALEKAYGPALGRLESITAGDFAAVPLEPGDLVFADPPYDDGFTDYTPAGFSGGDQRRLVDYLADHDGPIVITNAGTSYIKSLYSRAGYSYQYTREPRAIVQEATGPAPCIIATRNTAGDWPGRPQPL